MLPGPFLRLQLRSAAFVYVAVRVCASMALAFAARTPQDVVGVLIGIGIVTITTLLVEVDQRRNGAPDLFANLGISRSRLILIAAMPAFIGEVALIMALSVATSFASTVGPTVLRHV